MFPMNMFYYLQEKNYNNLVLKNKEIYVSCLSCTKITTTKIN